MSFTYPHKKTSQGVMSGDWAGHRRKGTSSPGAIGPLEPHKPCPSHTPTRRNHKELCPGTGLATGRRGHFHLERLGLWGHINHVLHIPPHEDITWSYVRGPGWPPEEGGIFTCSTSNSPLRKNQIKQTTYRTGNVRKHLRVGTESFVLWRPSHLKCCSGYDKNSTFALMCAG
jgi:hypothetical protein